MFLSRQRILEEKASGNYSCPHFVPPDVAHSIAESLGYDLSHDAAKVLAELSENFALEVLRCCQSRAPTPENLRTIVGSATLM